MIERRDIRFRAWDEINKEMIQPKGFDLTNGQLIDRYENIMQFIGHKDKKGQDIYEGDIITKNISWDNKPRLITSVVSYYVDGFRLTNIEHKIKKNYLNQVIIPTPKSCNFRDWATSEIIGNIYENPELLNGQK